MLAFLIALIAQTCVTRADLVVKKQYRDSGLGQLRAWVLRYSITRYAGLCLRLYALFLLPVAGAATLFSASAITMSSVVAWRHGETLSNNERAAIALILLAVLVRSLA